MPVVSTTVILTSAGEPSGRRMAARGAIGLLRSLRNDGVDIGRRQPRGADQRAVFEGKVAAIEAARHTAECERSEARSLDAQNRRQNRSPPDC